MMDKARFVVRISLPMLFGLCLALPAYSADEPPSFEHAPIRPAEKGWVAENENGDQPIEDITTFCMDCHQNLDTSARGKTHGPDSGVRSHPVDHPYPENGTDLVPLADLDKRLLLFDGNLSCITCHAHNTPDHQLVISDSFGQLCISCHRK